MKNTVFLFAVLLIACTTRDQRTPMDLSPVGGTPMADDTREALPQPEMLIAIDSGWQRLDSLYNHPAINSRVEGAFVNAYLATDRFLTLTGGVESLGKIAVICLTTGLGAATGDGEVSFDYELEYVYLIALEKKEANWIFRDILKIGESESSGTVTRLVRVTPMPLRNQAELLVVNLESSELSAGDYGKRLVTEEVMALMNGFISGIFQITREDLTFTSDEVSNYSKDLITSTYSMREDDGTGLGDVEVITTHTKNGMEDGISVDEWEEIDTVLYRFDGRAYLPIFE